MVTSSVNASRIFACVASWWRIRSAVRVRTSVATCRNPSISFSWRVPPAEGASLWTRSSIVPGSRSWGLRRDLLDSGGGEAEEASGVETSEADSSSGGGVEDGEGRDFRCLLEGVGLVSRV